MKSAALGYVVGMLYGARAFARGGWADVFQSTVATVLLVALAVWALHRWNVSQESQAELARLRAIRAHEAPHA